VLTAFGRSRSEEDDVIHRGETTRHECSGGSRAFLMSHRQDYTSTRQTKEASHGDHHHSAL
jgi:hypothetical protein